jgi:hypothetical protein
MDTNPSSSAPDNTSHIHQPPYIPSKQVPAPATESGSTQEAQAPQSSGSAFGFYDPHGAVLFSSTLTLMDGLGALNNFLEIFSKTILQHDLHEDGVYAEELGRLTFKEGTNKTVVVFNQNQEQKQSTLQALMKAHQNVESMDIQNASATTSTQQQLSSLISQTFQLIDQIDNSINTMNK